MAVLGSCGAFRARRPGSPRRPSPGSTHVAARHFTCRQPGTRGRGTLADVATGAPVNLRPSSGHGALYDCDPPPASLQMKSSCPLLNTNTRPPGQGQLICTFDSISPVHSSAPIVANTAMASLTTIAAGGAGASSPFAARPPMAAPTRTVRHRASLLDALAFSDPSPERINGRLAMVGFVSALAVEASRGDGLLSQAGSGSGPAWFVATATVTGAAAAGRERRGQERRVHDRRRRALERKVSVLNPYLLALKSK
ncbi:hypothetical protein PR202_gb12451 [Eleusine coracana subsp. coracana]|uniref:Uncharacterized protein n=1 Tax=Eleusine coracana subsp. coracana TaxID=191504 RepID=A0AAV5EQ44_ELECO|nr:hypothetical protein PR202_gb12451 [Eleusine coracana subsp. coracana]